jgi:hypothetical protein
LNVNCPATQQPQQQFAGPAAGLPGTFYQMFNCLTNDLFCEGEKIFYVETATQTYYRE